MGNCPIQAIAGLGNPGAKYAPHRHNAGFWLVDELAARAAAPAFSGQRKLKGQVTQAQLGGQTLHLFKPSTYMNNSGEAVRPLLDFYKITPAELLVIHDDMDLPPGTARLKRGGGHGGHNGLRDINRVLGPDYARLRIGIGHPGHRDRVLGYVLSAPGAAEMAQISSALDRAGEALATLCEQGWDKAMQQLHTEAQT